MPSLRNSFYIKNYATSEAGKSSASHIFTGWLQQKSARSGSSYGSSDMAQQRGQFFPAKLAMAFGMAKILLALLIIAFGVLALLEQASMSNYGSGLWCGAVVIVSGLFGVMSAKRSDSFIYIISYLVTSVLALVATGLLIVFSASGLATDSDTPWGYFVDEEDGRPIEFLGTVPLRQRPVIVSSVLVCLGTLEVILSLSSIVISLREACMCYSSSWSSSSSLPNLNLLGPDHSPEGQARAYRLLKWLGQHRNHHVVPQRLPTAAPISVITPVAAAPVRYPTYVIPSMLPSMMTALPTIGAFAAYAPFYPVSLHSLPSTHLAGQDDPPKRPERKEKRRRRRKSAPAKTEPADDKPQEDRKDSLPSELSDNGSFIFTGQDRELGEEFIQHSMEPSRSLALQNRFTDIDV